MDTTIAGLAEQLSNRVKAGQNISRAVSDLYAEICVKNGTLGMAPLPTFIENLYLAAAGIVDHIREAEKKPEAGQELVQAWRLLIYHGSRKWVEDTLQRSGVPLNGTKFISRANLITSKLITDFMYQVPAQGAWRVFDGDSQQPNAEGTPPLTREEVADLLYEE